MRGKYPNYSPIVLLRCRSDFYAPLFPDLQRNFLTPLQSSEYRMVIDRIEIDATCEDASQWTAVLHLDTGARIAITNATTPYSEFLNPDGPPYFDASLRRAFSGLEAERRRDPKLRRYIQELRRRIALNSRSA